MRTEKLWKRLAGMIWLLGAAVVVVPTARGQTVVATGTLTQKVMIDLTGQAGSAKGTIDAWGNVSVTTSPTTATFTIQGGPVPYVVGDSFQVVVPLTDECSVTGVVAGGTGAFANAVGSLNLTGSPCLLTPDISSFRIAASGSITLMLEVDESCQPPFGGAASTACENQSVSIEPPIVGTPYEFYYRSERVPGRTGTGAFLAAYAHDLGGWTLNVRHAYDPVSGNLYLGSGGRRRGAVLGTPPVMGGNYMVTNEAGTEVYFFDATGRHLRTRDALTGAVVFEFGYDANSSLKTVTDSAGNVTTFQRDASGNITAIVGPYGQTTTITVNSDGYITQITNPNQESMTLTYASGGLITSMSDALGNVDKFQYDSQGLLTHADHAGGASEDLVRNSIDGSIQLTTAAGVTKNYATDLSTRGQESRTVTFASGLQGKTLSSATSFSASRPNGSQLQMSFAPDPRWGIQAPVVANGSAATPGGNTSTGTETRSIKLSNPADPFSLTSMTDTVSINGRPTVTAYNGTARTLSKTSPAGRTGNAAFDAKGRMVRQQLGSLDPTAFNYNELGQLNSIVLSSGAGAQTTSFTYNNQGYLASMTDAAQRLFSFEYDGAGRMTKQHLPQGADLLLGYDAIGELTSVTTPGKTRHTLAYSAPGRLTNYSPPPIDGVNAEISLIYDGDGKVTRMVRGGQTVDIGYDDAGRTSTVGMPNGTIAYTYESSTGNLAGISAPGDVTISRTYDGALLTQETWIGPVSGMVANTYDNNFFLVARSVNDSTIEYQLDPDGLLMQAGTLSVTRNAMGMATGTSIDNIEDTFSYDSTGEPSSYSANVNGSPLYSAQYVRDSLGRLAQKTETIQGVSNTYLYTYDMVGQLSSVTTNGTVTGSYTYDNNGNRLSYTGANGPLTGQYDAQDRLTAYGTATYIYRDDGQLLSRTDGQATTSYQSDALGHLLGVTLADGTQIEYVVDGNGRRIAKKVNGLMVRGWLYQDDLHPVAELDGSGKVVSVFVYAFPGSGPTYMISNGSTYRIISDEAGNPRLVVDTISGAVAQRLDYDAFGQVVQDTNPGFQPFGFAGGLYDPDTGFVHFGARDYDPVPGRWIAKDPILFAGGTVNLYSYGLNDPVNTNDPAGLTSFKDWLTGCGRKLSFAWDWLIDWVKSKLCYGPACISADRPEISLHTGVNVQVDGQTVVNVGTEGGGGIKPGVAEPHKPFFYLFVKVGVKIPVLSKIPVIGKYFKTDLVDVHGDVGTIDNYEGHSSTEMAASQCLTDACPGGERQ